MTVRSVLKWTPLGFGLQMFFVVLFDIFVGLGKISDTGYGPWLELGKYAIPVGAGGDTMAPGSIFGLLFGMLVYSVIVAAIISLIRQPRYE